MTRDAINKATLLLLVLVISLLFLAMIRHFLMALLLAGIFSAMARPLYQRLEKWLDGRRSLASITTLLVIIIVLILPLGGLLGVITAEAIKVGQSVTPWVENLINEPAAFSDLLDSIPFYDRIEPYSEIIIRKAGEIVGMVSKFFINSLSSATMGTVNFFLLTFIFLYAMFFFLIDGDRLLDKILYYLPLEDEDERRMLDKFTSVTRATLKGTAVIGILQGGLAGLALAVVGFSSAIFWGTIMAVLSIIPGIGTALVWGPAAIILAAGGHWIKAIGLTVFCGVVVGSIDNVLRPRLVGKDTEMHDLLILFATLGGISFFGVVGFILGPIIAALFVTIWEIYGTAFKDVLPKVTSPDGKDPNERK
jgi:predicted PurR-regulated permease PerM